jgi:hypothetical protein
MAKFKKKTVSTKSIADAVAEQLGLRKGQTKAIVEVVLHELSKQFITTGYMRLPNLGTINILISVRSGVPKPYYTFRPVGRLKAFLATMCTDRTNAPFLEYLLERDHIKYERQENGRLARVAAIKQWRKNDENRERERLAKMLSDKTGEPVDPDSIPEEYLTPLRVSTARLPDHRITVREMLAKTGVLSPQTEDPRPNPEESSPLESLPDSNTGV